MNKVLAWIQAARPRTWTASLVPVFLGTALAMGLQDRSQGKITLLTMLCALLIQIATNYINDAIDFKKGADTQERLGPQRAAQSGLLSMQQLLFGGGLALFAALILGIPLMLEGGIPILVLFLISIVCAYLYTGGPWPLAYCGLGDLFVLFFFGIVSTSAVYYLQAGRLDFPVIYIGFQIGLLATALIAINNLRDLEGDARASKRTLAVRFGKSFARFEISLCVLLPFLLNFYWLKWNNFWITFLPFLTLPLAIKIVANVWKNEPSREYNRFLGQAALLHLSFGLSLALSFL